MPAGLRRDLGTIESYAAIIGILVGAGIFKVTADAWFLTGASVVLGYFVLAPAVLATSVAYSVFISTPLGREPGGEYAHISRTFGGYRLAFIGVWLKIISYIGALAYLARAFADYSAGGTATAVAILIAFYVIHIVGVRWFGRVQVWMCVILGLSLLVLLVPGLFAVRASNFQPMFAHGLRGFAATLPLLFFAYAGFESLAQTAGEVRDSTRRLPRVFLLGIAATMLIYLLMSIVGIGVLPGASFTAVAARYLPRGSELIVTIGALMAITTSINATMIVPSRVAIMLADDRLAPRWLGRVSPKTGTPILGLTITVGAALVLLLANAISLALNIAVFALVVLYFLHSYALLVLPRRNPALFASVTVGIPPWVQRMSAIVSMISMGAIIALQLTSLPTIELAAGWALAGAILYGVRAGFSRPTEVGPHTSIML
ncbi:MAG TPA: APC family permease [Thermoanaerobaculia bacterium]|nr:APC family permease [Thermoanaerobaculia bacterium]